MPTSNACDAQADIPRRAGGALTLQDLREALADQHIPLPIGRMDSVFQEIILLQRQRALVNCIVGRNELSDIHTVISRATKAL